MNPQTRAQGTQQGPEIRDEMPLLNRSSLPPAVERQVTTLLDLARHIDDFDIRANRELDHDLCHWARRLPARKTSLYKRARRLRAHRREVLWPEIVAARAQERAQEAAGW